MLKYWGCSICFLVDAMIKIISAMIFGALIVVISICKPSWLNQNPYITDLVGSEALALMAVILTVTLASVANIHFSINRMLIDKFAKNQTVISAASDVKKELKDNILIVFFGFGVAFFVQFLGGLAEPKSIVVAFMNGIVVWVLFLYLLCLFDIYKVVFGLAELELDLETNADSA